MRRGLRVGVRIRGSGSGSSQGWGVVRIVHLLARRHGVAGDDDEGVLERRVQQLRHRGAARRGGAVVHRIDDRADHIRAAAPARSVPQLPATRAGIATDKPHVRSSRGTTPRLGPAAVGAWRGTHHAAAAPLSASAPSARGSSAPLAQGKAAEPSSESTPRPAAPETTDAARRRTSPVTSAQKARERTHSSAHAKRSRPRPSPPKPATPSAGATEFAH
eukprot:7386148-Prymnesium_polylepis.2